MTPYVPEAHGEYLIDPATFNRLVQDVRSLQEAVGEGVVAGLSLRNPPDNTPFEAIILSNVGNQHSWARLATQSGGPTADTQDPAEQGTASLGTSILPAYAIDGSTLAPNTRVLMWYADTGTEMRCIAMSVSVSSADKTLAPYSNATPVLGTEYATTTVVALPSAGTYVVTWNLLTDVIAAGFAFATVMGQVYNMGGSVSALRSLSYTTAAVSAAFASFRTPLTLATITHKAVVTAADLNLVLKLSVQGAGTISNLNLYEGNANWIKIA